MKCPHCFKEFMMADAKIRSTTENRYYWGVVLELLSQETGYSTTEMHELCRSMFLNEKITYVTSKGTVQSKIIPITTTGLTVYDFENYLAKIRQWASMELSVYIPLPNEEAV